MSNFSRKSIRLALRLSLLSIVAFLPISLSAAAAGVARSSSLSWRSICAKSTKRVSLKSSLKKSSSIFSPSLFEARRDSELEYDEENDSDYEFPCHDILENESISLNIANNFLR